MNIVEYAKCKKMFGSGGGGDRPLGFWFMTKNDQSRVIVFDDDWNEIGPEDRGIKESITVPPQVQDGSATSFTDLFAHFYYDDYLCSDIAVGVWAKEICGVINCANVTSLESLFQSCAHTERICPIINTENVTNFRNMFWYCEELEYAPTIDIRNANDVSFMFAGCWGLKSVGLKNIRISLDLSPSDNLTVDGLVGLCYELIDTGSTKTLTIGKPNLARLDNVYVKSIPITDAMRAEDDLIDGKMPFVRCESTDDDKVLITDYIKAKNWALK